MNPYYLWVLALLIAAMLCFAFEAFLGFKRGIALGLLCWSAAAFSSVVNQIAN